MLGIAQRAARVRRTKRRVIRGAGMLAVLVIVWMLIPHRAPQVNAPLAIVPPQVTQQHSIQIERIATDPTIAARLSVMPDPHWQAVGDDELLQSLASAGQSGGLIKMDGETVLVTSQEQ
jgi:hypothetical protein